MSLLLVPGYMLDETLWDDVAGRLDKFGPLVHADLRHDATIEAMASRALANAPCNFILVGFSMGGYVAREIVRMAPGRVQALVLIATSTRPDSPALRQSRGTVGKAAASVSFSGLSRTAIATALHPQERGNEVLIERVRAMGVRLGGEVFRRQSALERAGDRGRLHEIRCPTLVIAAGQDRLRSREESEELHAGIPGAEYVVIEESGHMLPLEAPEALLAAVLPWLERVAPV
ncbi:alpha/beta fold hydrolase [Telluria aromaticivorans]|uniref:Alpha/beta hydrolase n=1 Tax=Telluria aromaticivorans TaxID=2725995 RepID=A0A7Y2P2A2_9BURK|nr:alpha/beta hydrolase [Telluria aromaticivorans]NNG24734.1 alpha/beta hydrolase [Telluria aromaticivorans]